MNATASTVCSCVPIYAGEAGAPDPNCVACSGTGVLPTGAGLHPDAEATCPGPEHRRRPYEPPMLVELCGECARPGNDKYPLISVRMHEVCLLPRQREAAKKPSRFEQQLAEEGAAANVVAVSALESALGRAAIRIDMLEGQLAKSQARVRELEQQAATNRAIADGRAV